MALSDHDLAPRKKGPSCTVGVLAARMDPEDAGTFAAWMDDPDHSASAIAEGLNDEYNVSIQANTVQRHRRGDCRC